ncbi:MAG: nucleotidyltransferase family protein, partial [Planctomycetota bacterium]
ASLLEARAAIARAGSQIALVVDDERLLLGTLSDGDVRRALLRGVALEDRVEVAMHRSPTVARAGNGRAEILRAMQERGLHQIPTLDDAGRVTGLSTVDDFLLPAERPEWVVVMAGGLGTRLRELTQKTPKPMLEVGGRPILETIVRNFHAQGFRRFFFAVNFKAEVVESHFGDGSALGVEIQYLREKERMGTAGALSLLPRAPEESLILTNADLLAKVDYVDLLDAHGASGADATMAVREFEMQIPFGVVEERDGAIARIDEKPVHRSIVNAGIYVLSPSALPLVPRAYFDVTTLFEKVVERGLRAATHHVDGYWMDIGRLPDYERANSDFDAVFP